MSSYTTPVRNQKNRGSRGRSGASPPVGRAKAVDLVRAVHYDRFLCLIYHCIFVDHSNLALVLSLLTLFMPTFPFHFISSSFCFFSFGVFFVFPRHVWHTTTTRCRSPAKRQSSIFLTLRKSWTKAAVLPHSRLPRQRKAPTHWTQQFTHPNICLFPVRSSNHWPRKSLDRRAAMMQIQLW